MQMRDDEWMGWMEAFRTSSDTHEIELDPVRLASQARAETRKQWLGLAGELGMGGIAIAVYGVLIVRGTTAAVHAIAAGSFAYSVVWLAYLYYVRRGTWRALGQTTRAALALTMARRRADAYWYRFVSIATVAFAVAVAGWAPFMLSTYREVYAVEPWRAIVGFGGAFVVLTIVFVRAQRLLSRARREHSALDAAYRDLLESS